MKEIFIICDKVFIFSFIYFNNKILYNDGGDNMDVSNLSIREKIGQKFIVGVNSNNIDVLIDLIKKYYIGGVILYKKNYNNYDEMLSVIKKLKEANKDNKVPLFVAIDQEGGRVNRMPSEFNNLKNIYTFLPKIYRKLSFFVKKKPNNTTLFDIFFIFYSNKSSFPVSLK